MRPTRPPVASDDTKAPDQPGRIEERKVGFLSHAFLKDLGMEVGAVRIRGTWFKVEPRWELGWSWGKVDRNPR